MPGHLLLYHPGVQRLKEMIGAGELGEVLCVYGNRQNLGIIRSNENALWSLGVHDLIVILYLLDEEPEKAIAFGRDFLTDGVEDVVFCYLRFPSGKIAHMHLSWLDPHKMRKITVVGTEKMVVFDDMELERKVTVYEKAPWRPSDRYGEWQTRTGDIFSPRIASDEPLKLECIGVPAARSRVRATAARSPKTARASCVRSTCWTTSLEWQLKSTPPRPCTRGPFRTGREGARERRRRQAAGAHPARRPSARLFPGGDRRGNDRLDGARSCSPDLASARVILGDQSCVRERVTIGDDVVLGQARWWRTTRRSERDAHQAEAYITAYSTLEEHVFVAPCVLRRTTTTWAGPSSATSS